MDKKLSIGLILIVLLIASACSKKEDKDSGSNLVNSLSSPVLSNLQYVSGLERTEIAWTTDTKTTTQVLLGTTSQTYNFATSEDGTLVKEHLVYLVPLASNTTFYFKVVSKDVDHNTVMSDEYSFVTPTIYLPDTTSVLTAEDNNETLATSINALIELQLEENGSTGYGWYFSNFDTVNFEILSEGTRILKPMIGGAGAPVLHYWQIKMKQAGTVGIKLKYYRNWEGESSSINEYTVTLQIR